MKKINYSDEDFKKAVSSSKSYAEVCRNIGLSDKGGNIKTVRTKIQEMKLDTQHFTGQRWNKGLKGGEHPSIKRKELSEILVKDSGWGSSSLKRRLFSEGVKDQKCEICGQSNEWMGKPLSLQLHHINGNHRDNRLENLMILCPNCHTQTDNYSGRSNSGELSASEEIPGVEVG